MIYTIFVLITLQFSGCGYNSGNQPNTHEAERINPSAKSDSLDYESKINELKNSLTEDFIIRKESYFVIASNLTREETDKIADNTINRAVECFYNDYFIQKVQNTG